MNIHHNLSNKPLPHLVSHKIMKNLSKILKTTAHKEPTWRENLEFFYTDYIKPNLFALIVFMLIGVFLVLKYYNKQENEIIEKREKKRKRKNSKHRLERSSEQRSEPSSEHVSMKMYYHPDSHKYKYDDQNYYADHQHIYEPDRRIYADDEENRDTDEISFSSLSKDYERSLAENDGTYSDMMVKDTINQKRARLTFDEMAKMVSGK